MKKEIKLDDLALIIDARFNEINEKIDQKISELKDELRSDIGELKFNIDEIKAETQEIKAELDKKVDLFNYKLLKHQVEKIEKK